MGDKKQVVRKADVLIPAEIIENRIYLIRGRRVMLDRDLAGLYGVPTKRLKEQVRRNLKRFPADFMFELTWEEAAALASRPQIATLKKMNPSSLKGRSVFTRVGSEGRWKNGMYPTRNSVRIPGLRADYALGPCPQNVPVPRMSRILIVMFLKGGAEL